jgi:hypothetical protein
MRRRIQCRTFARAFSRGGVPSGSRARARLARPESLTLLTEDRPRRRRFCTIGRNLVKRGVPCGRTIARLPAAFLAAALVMASLPAVCCESADAAALATRSAHGEAGITHQRRAQAALAAAVLPSFDHRAVVAGYGGGNMTAVSCASSRMCVAVDALGAALVFNGRSWSAPRPAEPVRSGTALTGVSCPRVNFCIAVDENGAALIFNGRTWSAPVVIDNASAGDSSVDLPLTSVSCATPHFCVATDAGSNLTDHGDLVMFDGTNLAGAQTLSNGNPGLNSVSCISAAFCLAVSDGGTSGAVGGYQIWRNGGWTVRTNIAGNAWTSASCVSASFCAASDNLGNVSIFNGTRWTRPRPIVPILYTSSVAPSAVSCFSTRDCVVVADNREATWRGSRWGAALAIDDPQTFGLTGVSCPAARFCAAVDNGNGQTFASAAIFTGRSWQRRPAVDRSDYITAVSCASTAFCELTSAGGLAASFTGTSWSRPVAMGIVAGQQPQSLSCPAAGTCVASDASGNAFDLKNGRWRRVHLFSSPYITGPIVSCASATRCIGVITSGAQFTTFNGTSWSRLRRVKGVSLGFGGVSCLARTRVCVAVTADGTALTLRGLSWSRPVNVPSSPLLTTVSCASVRFCMTSDDFNGTWRFNGAKWSALQVGAFQQFSCSAVGFCAAFSSYPIGITYYENSQWILVTTGFAAVYQAITSASCVTESFCMVTDAGGQAFWN